MAADLHIHTFKEGELSEADFRCFNGNTIGSKWFGGFMNFGKCKGFDCEHWRRIEGTSNEWIGEVSWLKAALLEDEETYIPSTVQQVAGVIGEDWPVIDDALIEKIRQAFTAENKTNYSLAEAPKVLAFLEDHRGERAFTVSW